MSLQTDIRNTLVIQNFLFYFITLPRQQFSVNSWMEGFILTFPLLHTYITLLIKVILLLFWFCHCILLEVIFLVFYNILLEFLSTSQIISIFDHLTLCMMLKTFLSLLIQTFYFLLSYTEHTILYCIVYKLFIICHATVGNKIIRALEIIRVKKLILNAVWWNKYLSSQDLQALCCL